jgi:hypothetical protein
MSLPPGRLLLAAGLLGWVGSSVAATLPAGAVLCVDPAGVRPGGAVFALAYSPDGKLLASGSADGKVRLWEAATGKEVRQLKGHIRRVKSVAFTADGKLLVSGSHDGTARLWEAANGKQLRVLGDHGGPVEAVAITPDGQTVASAGRDGLVRLWRAETGKELRRLKGHRGSVFCLAFAPGGKLLGSGGADRTVRFWDPARGKERRRVRGPGWVYGVSFSADGKVVASGGRDQMVHLWDPVQAEGLNQFGGYEGEVASVALAADGKMTADGSGDHQVRLWENESGQVRRLFAGHGGPVHAVALSPDGLTLASGGEDAAIFIWDVTGRLKDGKVPPADLPPARKRAVLWSELGHTDAARAYRTMGLLTAASGQAVALLKERTRPFLEIQARVARLVKQLDSRKYAERARAVREIEQLGELAVPALREALERTPSVEVRLRLKLLSRKLEKPDDESQFSGRLQLLRAVEVLEHIGTPEARQLLAALAKGLPTDWGKREAKAAVARLEKRTRGKP